MGKIGENENKPAGLSCGARAQMADDQAFEQRQLSVKEMAAPGDNRDRK